MKHINYIGLDMDHTLLRYNSENFESISHKAMVDKLVHKRDYPKSILKLKLDYNRAIRGLVIDKSRGNILKLSRYGAIKRSFHGLTPIDHNQQKKLYKSTYIDLSDSNFETVDTAFSIAFASLFAQLVDLKDTSESKTLPDYNTIAHDLIFVLDRAHRDGTIKDEVINNLSKFIVQDPEVVAGLEKYIKHGKKLFIATNSDYEYTKVLLDYTITPFLKDHDHWLDIFDYVLTLTQKPRFFYDKLSFLKVDAKTGNLSNLQGKIKEKGIYQGGCANQFTNDLDLVPSEILYIGDHIYGDIVRLKKDCSWRTALVVEEINEEIQSIDKAKEYVGEIEKLMDKKVPLEFKINTLISDKIENKSQVDQAEVDKLIEQVQELDHQISPLIKKQEALHNPYWGEVFRAGIEETYIAYQVDRFACIYMSKLPDLLELSPRTYFRSKLRHMAHENT